MGKLVWLILGLDYILLPMAYAKSIPLFFIMLILSVGLAMYRATTISQKVFQLYIWSFSFFGLSIFGVKLFDWVALISLLYIILARKKIFINMNFLYLVPFYFYITIQCIVLIMQNYEYENNVILELVRYILAILTGFVFSQLSLKNAESKKWLDNFSILVILQAIIMYVLQTRYAVNVSSNLKYISIQLFSDNNESRISAFFSDPNKMMTFFFVLLFIRLVLILNDKHKIQWTNSFFIYLVGAVLSLSRTSVISVVLFLSGYVLYRVIFKNSSSLATFSVLVVGIIFLVMISYFKAELLHVGNVFFDYVLQLFGRTRTVMIDSSLATDSRVEVWKDAYIYIKQSPIFGNGLLSEESLLPIPTHNTVIQLLLDTGILGLLLYFVGVLLPIFKRTPSWIAITLLIIPMLFLDLANFRLIFVLLGIILQRKAKESTVEG
ncbi:O-antigen ligase family protein [Levilactobacillus namurensis]|uniref:O-antigen ligase family protein n=1 Tax=Levilactobacillus namurensis TaxID=380393 RepID=UPI0026EDC021|nr:O-antigen ligase family protein [Levilactobacillus namurensis]